MRLFMLISLSIVLCILLKEGLEEETPRYAKRDWRSVPAHRLETDGAEPRESGTNPRIPCWYDSRCMSGECWVGWCGEHGYCLASWTCA